MCILYISHTERIVNEGKTLQVITYLHTIFREIANDNPDLPEKVKVHLIKDAGFSSSLKLMILLT